MLCKEGFIFRYANLLDSQEVTNNLHIAHMPDKRLQVRIGMNSGPIAAGVNFRNS